MRASRGSLSVVGALGLAAGFVVTSGPDAVAHPAPAAPASATPENFERLRQCESNGNYATRTGNGYYGAYQFSLSTWRSVGYTGYPNEAPPSVQDEAAKRLQARDGWAPWPACSRKLGLR